MTHLSELCVAIVDCEHKTAPKSGDGTGYALVRTTNIGRGRLDLTNVHRIEAAAYEKWTRRAVPQPGDLILAREAPVGNVALVASGMEPVLGQRTVLIRPDEEKVDAGFLTYRLLAHDLQHWMNGVANGATVPHLNMEDIRALPMPELPTLRAQGQIGTTLAAFDDLIENNRRQIKVLEEITRLLYRKWFVHFRFPGHEGVQLVDSDLGLIPEGWAAGEFSDLVSEIKETVAPEDIARGTPVVGLENLPRRSTTLHEWENASDVGSRRKVFVESDILFGKIRPYFHKVVDAPFSGYSSTDAIVFRPKEHRLKCRALAVASSDEFVGVATATSNGTKMPRANTEILMTYGVPHPTEYVERAFSQTVGPMGSLRQTLAAQSRKLREARDLLLPRLVSGEFDVSELNLGLVAG